MDTIKADNTQTLYNALAEIDRLKADREAEVESLWRIIEKERRQAEVLRGGLVSIMNHQSMNVKSNNEAMMGTTWYIANMTLCDADKIAKE